MEGIRKDQTGLQEQQQNISKSNSQRNLLGHEVGKADKKRMQEEARGQGGNLDGYARI